MKLVLGSLIARYDSKFLASRYCWVWFPRRLLKRGRGVRREVRVCVRERGVSVRGRGVQFRSGGRVVLGKMEECVREERS